MACFLLALAAVRAWPKAPPAPSTLASERIRGAGGETVALRSARGEGAYRLRVADLAADARLTLGVPLDPNEEPAEALALLPGIGPTLAGAIVEDRERRGPFRTVEDLDRVRGIGPKTLTRLRPYVAVGAGASAR